METKNVHYTIAYNRSRKTYTIREYDQQGKLIAKYRSYPQGENYSENFSQADIKNFLKSDEYYKT